MAGRRAWCTPPWQRSGAAWARSVPGRPARVLRPPCPPRPCRGHRRGAAGGHLQGGQHPRCGWAALWESAGGRAPELTAVAGGLPGGCWCLPLHLAAACWPHPALLPCPAPPQSCPSAASRRATRRRRLRRAAPARRWCRGCLRLTAPPRRPASCWAWWTPRCSSVRSGSSLRSRQLSWLLERVGCWSSGCTACIAPLLYFLP